MARKEARNPFDAPSRTSREAGDETVRLTGIEEWVQALPVANIEKTAFDLYHKLDQLNRLEIPAAERYQMLERLRKPPDLGLSQLAKQFSINAPSLSRREQQLADLAQQLRAFVAVAYKIAAVHVHRAWLAAHLTHRGIRSRAIHRVMYYLGRMLLADYHLYRPCTAFLWREIHGIYHYAERARIGDKPVDNEDTTVELKSTIEDQYKALLLLALAVPYRLFQGQATKVYQLLEHWSPMCELRPAEGPDEPVGLFAVEWTEDKPPAYVENFKDKKFKGWYLDVEPLADILRMGLKEIEAGKAPFGSARPGGSPLEVGGDLLRTLMLSWGVRVSRSGPRLETAGQAHLVFGLEAIYRLLGGTKPQELDRPRLMTMPDQPAPKKTAPVIRADRDERLAWVRRADIVEQIDLEEEVEKMPQWAESDRKELLDASRVCEIDDRSEGGYQFTLPEDQESCARVGELLAINGGLREDDTVSWLLGIVRWMRIARSGDTEFGVQIIDVEAKPVVVERTHSGATYLERWLSLLVSSTGEKAEFIITPAYYAGDDDRFALIWNDQRQPIRLVNALEATASFAQFQFELEDSEDAEATGEPQDAAETGRTQGQTERNEDYFADLWRDL